MDTIDLAHRLWEVMATGSLDDFREVVHPDAVNHERIVEPPDARGTGPEAFHATAQWIRATYADLRWEVQHVAATDDIMVCRTLMSGRHVGPFVVYDADGNVDRVLAPTGKTFAITQSHWHRVVDGVVIEHWADRDDLGQATQLGWAPPTPAYLLRCALAKRRLRRGTS